MQENNTKIEDPQHKFAEPPYEEQSQIEPPGTENQLDPKADHGEESYKGSGRLAGRKALITGADSGIGRAVAIAFAREGADVLISYLNEHEDAQVTADWVTKAGCKAVLLAGDIAEESHCERLVELAVSELGGLDILVNNAAFQMSHGSLQEITSDEWRKTFAVNIDAMFYLCKAAERHLEPGSTVINTTSVNARKAPPHLIAYSATKAAIQNFTASLGQLWASKGIRVNAVAPGPVWTPLIPSTLPEDKYREFGNDVPLGRSAQPAELAAPFVLLASQESSYMTGSVIHVNGGYPAI